MAPVVSSVQKNYPAKEVGLEKGDEILEINGHNISTSDDISLFLTVADPKEKTTIVVERKGKEKTFFFAKRKFFPYYQNMNFLEFEFFHEFGAFCFNDLFCDLNSVESVSLKNFSRCT